jgi:hypothetical protein
MNVVPSETSPVPVTDSTDCDELNSQTTFFHGSKRIQWTQELCREAVATYEEHCRQTAEIPTGRGYQQWQRERKDLPSFRTLLRFVDARKWTRNQCIAALQAYQADCEREGKFMEQRGYREWKKQHSEAPSDFTIMKHLGGTFTEARRRVREIAEPSSSDLPT